MNLALQGELIGEGIQGNREGLRGQDFYLFDIYNIDEGRYLPPDERSARKSLIAEFAVINHVPRLQIMKPFQMSLDELLEFANGPSLNNPIREGLVFKSVRPLPPTNQIVTFKVISNKYLENGGE
jgi:ATP-dependent RNA circularization protein (DNA/RNA ligase family)